MIYPALPKEYDKVNIKQCRVSNNIVWHYVYLLKSQKTSWIYIGCTSNLEKRLRDHGEGRVYSTRKMLR